MTKKRVQGESPRIEPCPDGGSHKLMRPVQIYCDRCRPDDAARALERQRRRRAALRSPKPAQVMPQVAKPVPSVIGIASQHPQKLWQRLLVERREIEQLRARVRMERNRRMWLGESYSEVERFGDEIVKLAGALESAESKARQLRL